jgi:hypothetical protein
VAKFLEIVYVMNFVGMTDISGCFDRILAPVISLLKNQKNGCPKAAVPMHATTLEKARYYLKTKHGISEGFYSHSSETPIYGNGQGAGDSPSQWCQQSAMLFDIYSLKIKGATMTSPTGRLTTKIALAAFADDTNLLGNQDNIKLSNTEALVQQAQTAFTTWNGLLHATGHFMELEKCSCFLLVWSFQEDGYAFTEEPEMLPWKIMVQDVHGNATEIPKLATTKSQKLLGVMKNPISNQQDEIIRLREKSDNLARNINSHALNRVEATMAYESFYLPAMRYSMAITSINQVDMETIQKRATMALLAALGFNRNMPREIVYCSSRYQGIGIKHLYDIQGFESIKLFVQELNHSNNTTKMMLQILLEVMQLEAGIEKPIMEDTRPLQYIEWGWIAGIRDFLDHINASITNATKGLQKYRENDLLLMDSPEIATSTRKEQILINRCRLRLQIECLSDITNAEGTQILPEWYNHTTTKSSHSVKQWPRQESPGPEAWKIWRKFLRSFLTMSDKLKVPLGKWTSKNETRSYMAYISEDSKKLYRRSAETWILYNLESQGR